MKNDLSELKWNKTIGKIGKYPLTSDSQEMKFNALFASNGFSELQIVKDEYSSFASNWISNDITSEKLMANISIISQIKQTGIFSINDISQDVKLKKKNYFQKKLNFIFSLLKLGVPNKKGKWK